MAEKLIVPLADAAEMLGGISRGTVYNLIDAGQLERVSIGSRAFVTRASVLALAESGTKAASA